MHEDIHFHARTPRRRQQLAKWVGKAQLLSAFTNYVILEADGHCFMAAGKKVYQIARIE
jgi:hypothetical protein